MQLEFIGKMILSTIEMKQQIWKIMLSIIYHYNIEGMWWIYLYRYNFKQNWKFQLKSWINCSCGKPEDRICHADNMLTEGSSKSENDKPIHDLSDIKTDAVIHAATEIIYPTFQFVAQLDHLDSATCFIYPKLVTDDQIKARIELNIGLALQNL